MNKPKCSEYLYVQFLLAAQNNFTCTELSSCAPCPMAHDAPTRLLGREKLTPVILWKNVQPHVNFNDGYLIADDTVIDKMRSQDIDLVHWQYSGAHHKVVKGIGLESFIWTNSDDYHIPIDYRIYDKNTDGKTKNQHFQNMLWSAKHRGFKPKYTLIDSWYTSLENLKLINKFNWKWIAQLRKNRIVSLQPHCPAHLEEIDIREGGIILHLKGYGFIKVFKTVSQQRGVEYYGTNDINLTKSDAERIYGRRWKIEEYHRGLKQQCGLAKCQARNARAQRNHIWCSIHAFVVLEIHRINTNISWQEAKLSIIREAIHQYLLKPRFELKMVSTA
jgi:putative transposase